MRGSPVYFFVFFFFSKGNRSSGQCTSYRLGVNGASLQEETRHGTCVFLLVRFARMGENFLTLYTQENPGRRGFTRIARYLLAYTGIAPGLSRVSSIGE